MKTSESKFCKCFYFTANALARKIEKLAIDSWKEANLSPSHAYLLFVVLEEPGVQPGFLSEQLQLTPSTVTRLIEKLEEKKLVSRTFEGKVTNVFPTDSAKALVPLMKKCMNDFYNKYNSLLGEQESAQLVRSMAEMADKLKD
jgi:MarR family transcriptional regulator, organic hydroperoxide resistance regulator